MHVEFAVCFVLRRHCIYHETMFSMALLCAPPNPIFELSGSCCRTRTLTPQTGLMSKRRAGGVGAPQRSPVGGRACLPHSQPRGLFLSLLSLTRGPSPSCQRTQSLGVALDTSPSPGPPWTSSQQDRLSLLSPGPHSVWVPTSPSPYPGCCHQRHGPWAWPPGGGGEDARHGSHLRGRSSEQWAWHVVGAH